MKKAYGTPKAEKMAFNYSEAVVASGTGCDYFITHTRGYDGCEEAEVTRWQQDTNA